MEHYEQAPHSIEAEQSIIGGMLSDANKLPIILDELETDDFYRMQHRELFSAAKALHDRGIAADPITLGDEITSAGGEYDLPYITSLMTGTYSTANLMHYARIIKDKSQRRKLYASLCGFCDASLNDQGQPLDKLLNEIASNIGALQGVDGDHGQTMDSLVVRFIESIDERSQRSEGLNGLSTGLARLDQRLNGMKNGNLIVMAGRPAMGKSAVAGQIGFYNAINQDKRVVFFSLEMTAQENIDRAAANFGSLPLDWLDKPDDNQQQWDRLKLVSDTLRRSNVIIDDTPNIHINQLCARTRGHNRKSPVDLVIVDHINIMKGDGQSREREIADITGKLKALAKEIDCPVIALTQLNRKVEDRTNKRPVNSDLRESGAIEQDADIILMCYRDDYYDQSLNPGMLEIICGKYRGGKVGTDYFVHKFDYARIVDQSADYTGPETQQDEGFFYE